MYFNKIVSTKGDDSSPLLHDEDDKVRMEAPEIFRILGKRRPEFVREKKK